MKKLSFTAFLLMFASVSLLPSAVAANEKKVAEHLNVPPENGAGYDFDRDERIIFDLVNRERSKRKLNNLYWRGDLAKLARSYAEKMARENFFSHYDKNGADVGSRAAGAKIKNWFSIGENLFYIEGKNDFDNFAVQKWMQSSGHRENILNRNWTAAGLGVAQSKNGRVYVVQVFMQEK